MLLKSFRDFMFVSAMVFGIQSAAKQVLARINIEAFDGSKILIIGSLRDMASLCLRCRTFQKSMTSLGKIST